MTTTHHPTIGNAVLFEFVVTCVYVFLVILGTKQPETLLGEAVVGWIEFTGPAVQVLFAPIPIPGDLDETVLFEAIGIYRHVLAACFLIACGCFVLSGRYWRCWSERLRGALSAVADRPGSQHPIALIGYRRMILSFVAVMFLMLYGENQVPAIAGYLFAADWTYLRAPLLTATAYAFACYAVALRPSSIEQL